MHQSTYLRGISAALMLAAVSCSGSSDKVDEFPATDAEVDRSVSDGASGRDSAAGDARSAMADATVPRDAESGPASDATAPLDGQTTEAAAVVPDGDSMSHAETDATALTEAGTTSDASKAEAGPLVDANAADVAQSSDAAQASDAAQMADAQAPDAAPGPDAAQVADAAQPSDAAATTEAGPRDAGPASPCDLYLGATDSFNGTPPTPFSSNPSIHVATSRFTVGTTYTIGVVLQSADPATGCSSALVKLYWSDPSASFPLQTSNLIGVLGNSVPAATPATTIPPAPQMDGNATFTFQWTPPADAASTNGGQIALVAVAECTSSDCFTPSPSPAGSLANTASPRVAVDDIVVGSSSAGH